METVYLPTTVDKVIDPFVDLGNLLIIDNDQPPGGSSASNMKEEELLELTRDNTQYLFNKIWELERKRVDEAIVAKLPEPILRLPREKVIPEKKQLTKWQQYAQEKGIRKRKKDRKVFDERSREWKPRYGYRRGNDDTKDWLIEIPDNKDPMVDYFAERKQAKSERIHKNEMQRLKNIARQMKKGTDTNALPLGVSKDLEGRTRHELLNQMDRARHATASLGKFQPPLKNEKPPKNTGKIHTFAPNENKESVSNERKRQLEIFENIAAKKPKLKESRLAASQMHAEKSSGESTRHEKGFRPRQKSAIHRQQHFQKMMKTAKKGRGNMRGSKRGGRSSRARGKNS